MKYDSTKLGVARFVGELEAELLEILWERPGLSAKEVLLQLRLKKKLASTTIHTVLSRLAQKQIVSCEKDGPIARWSVCQGREEFIGGRIAELTNSLKSEFPSEYSGVTKAKQAKTKKRAN